MKKHLKLIVALGLFVTAGGCQVFEDQSPESVNFRLSGSSGTTVQAVYSTRFTAGVTEDGVTQVRIFSADTVLQTLPIDTTVSIVENQQFFVEILPAAASDTLDVAVKVEIDGREVLENSGFIFPLNPWRYVYQFNQLLTQAVEVIL
jgi:hypothetical protein